jgi:hypothetical protein
MMPFIALPPLPLREHTAGASIREAGSLAVFRGNKQVITRKRVNKSKFQIQRVDGVLGLGLVVIRDQIGDCGSLFERDKRVTKSHVNQDRISILISFYGE